MSKKKYILIFKDSVLYPTGETLFVKDYPQRNFYKLECIGMYATKKFNEAQRFDLKAAKEISGNNNFERTEYFLYEEYMIRNVIE